MPAKNPEEICRLFKEYMAQGDLESLLSVYDPEVVFLNKAGKAKRSVQELREELAPFAAVRARFDFNIRQVSPAGDIALMHTEWKISSPQPMSVYAIEVARRQPDGTWRWLIGDPYYSRQTYSVQRCRRWGGCPTMIVSIPFSCESQISLATDPAYCAGGLTMGDSHGDSNAVACPLIRRAARWRTSKGSERAFLVFRSMLTPTMTVVAAMSPVSSFFISWVK